MSFSQERRCAESWIGGSPGQSLALHEMSSGEPPQAAQAAQTDAILDEKERSRRVKRFHVAQEILQTERSYVQSLLDCISVWYEPLLEAYNKGSDVILEMEDIQVIFSTLEHIARFHKRFLFEMEHVIALDNPEGKENSDKAGEEASSTAVAQDEPRSPTTQDPCPIPPGHIGALFKTFAPFLKMYTTYVNNHQRAIERLTDIIQSKRKKFLQFTVAASSDPRCRGNTLQSFLIKPVQRVPRYKLLLQELIKYTLDDDPDYGDLKNAFDAIETVAVHINNALRRQSNQADIYALQRQFTSAISLVAPDRTLVFQGPAIKHSRSGECTYHFILFNDCLMYVSASRSGKLTYHRSLTINDSFSVSDLDPSPYYPAPLPNQLQPDFGGVTEKGGDAAFPYTLSTGALLLNKVAVEIHSQEVAQAHANAQAYGEKLAREQKDDGAAPSTSKEKEKEKEKDKAKKRWSIHVFATEKSFKMSWTTQAEKELWLLHIRACMTDYRETVAQRQAEAAKALRNSMAASGLTLNTGGAARPIQLPRTKNSKCPGCNNGFGALDLAVVWCRVCGAPAHSACATARFYFDGPRTISDGGSGGDTDGQSSAEKHGVEASSARDSARESKEGEPVCSACFAIATASANERLAKLHERANQLGRTSQQIDITAEVRNALYDLCERKRLESAAMNPAETAAALAEVAAIGKSTHVGKTIPIAHAQALVSPQLSSPASEVQTLTPVTSSSLAPSTVVSPPNTVSSASSQQKPPAPAIPPKRASTPATPAALAAAAAAVAANNADIAPSPSGAPSSQISPNPPPKPTPSIVPKGPTQLSSSIQDSLYTLQGLSEVILSDLYSDTFNGIEIEEEDDYNDYDDFEFEGASGSRRNLVDSDDEDENGIPEQKEGIPSDELEAYTDYENDLQELLDTDPLVTTVNKEGESSMNDELGQRLRHRSRIIRKMALRRISYLASQLPVGVGIARLLFACESIPLKHEFSIGIDQTANKLENINAALLTAAQSKAVSGTPIEQGERVVVVARGSALPPETKNGDVARPYVAAFILTDEVGQRLTDLATQLRMSHSHPVKTLLEDPEPTLKVPLLLIPATYLVELGPSYVTQTLLTAFGMAEHVSKPVQGARSRRKHSTECPVAPWYRPLRDEAQYFEVAANYNGKVSVACTADSEHPEDLPTTVLHAERGDLFFALPPARQPGLPVFLSSTKKRHAWLAGINMSTREIGYIPSSLLIPQHRGLVATRFPTVQFASAPPEVILPTTPPGSSHQDSTDSTSPSESSSGGSSYFSFITKGVSSVKGAVSSVFRSYASPSGGGSGLGSSGGGGNGSGGGFSGFLSSVLGVGQSREATPETEVTAKATQATVTALAQLQAACYDKPSLGVLQTLRILEGLLICHVGK